MNNYKLKNNRWRLILPIASFLFVQGASGQMTENTVDDEDVYELSPFVIETDENVGYLATSTLAGTRLKTDLKDVGSAISVVTQEFLEDTGSTNAENLLVYTLSTEIGGSQGNFAGTGIASGNSESSNTLARMNPQSNTRVRGLSSAAMTRDYFLTSFGFDAYNTEAVTISRGPNSILFGIGEPGGIIENSIKKATFGADLFQVSLRIGSRGTHRQTLDFNREIIDKRLAVRVNAMNERIEFRQKPAYEEDQRGTVALTWNVFLNDNIDWAGPTVVRANYEKAEIRGTPPSTTPIHDTYSTWWQAPGTSEWDEFFGVKRAEGFRETYASQWIIDDIGDATTEGEKSSGQPELWSSYAIVWAGRGAAPSVGVNDLQIIDGSSGGFEMTAPSGEVITTPGWFPMYSSSTNPWNGYSGFNRLPIADRKIYDWEKLLLPGRSQYANHDFEALNVTLEQNFFDNKAGIQFVFDKQSTEDESQFSMGRHHYSSVRIDAGAYLPNGVANPNLGRPLVSGMWDPRNEGRDERTSKRFTAYYNLDFTENEGWTKWLGNHTINGLLNNWEDDGRWGEVRQAPDYSHDPDQYANTNVNTKPGSWGGALFYLAYVGDPQWDAATPNDLRLYQDYLRISPPKAGDEYRNYYYDKENEKIVYSTLKIADYLIGGGRRRQEIDSKAYTIQSKLLGDHIVATYGWREDSTDTWQTDKDKGGFRDPKTATYSYDLYTKGWITDDNGRITPVLSEKGETTTKQIVAHVPDDWMKWGGKVISGASFHWAESENFNPASVRRDLYNNVIGNPSGETTEKGIALSLLEGRAHLRLNWYETTSTNTDNDNIWRKLWMMEFPLGMANRWLSMKNQSFTPGGLQFEEYAWYGPNGAGPDKKEAVYEPERLGNFTSFDEVINAFIGAFPEDAREGYSNPAVTGVEGNQELLFPGPNGLKSVADTISEGFEIEAVFNVTTNWRIAVNASKTESSFGNGMKEVNRFAETVTENLRSAGLWDIASDPSESSETPTGLRWSNSALVAVAAGNARDGTVSTELRKWRCNFITNYQFSDGILKGLGLGGSLRWADKVSIGYPLMKKDEAIIPDLQKPYEGDSRIDGDLWFSYKTEIKGYPVKFQLNLQNAIGDRGTIPVAANPDGQLSVVRVAPEQRWFLTTTIDF